MTHKEVYRWFGLYFPDYYENIIDWFPNGKNSVRVRQCDGREFIFTYNGKTNWSFETKNSFIDRLKGEKK